MGVGVNCTYLLTSELTKPLPGCVGSTNLYQEVSSKYCFKFSKLSICDPHCENQHKACLSQKVSHI